MLQLNDDSYTITGAKMEFENTEKTEKTNPKTVRWYYKKWVRLLAGALAIVMIFVAISYSVMRSQVRSLYENISDSEDALKEISQNNAEDVDVYNNLDKINDYATLSELVDKGDYMAAIDKANEALNSEQDPDVKKELAEILSDLYYNSGMYQEAADIASLYYDEEEVSPSLCYVRGLAFLQLGSYSEAVNDLEMAKYSGLEDEDVLNLHLAIATYANSEYEAASEYSEDYLHSPTILNLPENVSDDTQKEIEENSNLCKYIAALSYMHQDEYKQSIAYIDELLEHTKDSEIYFYRGIDNMALEEYEAAIEDFEKAIEEGKKDTEVYYDLGICRVSCGKVDEGIDDLKRVINNNDKPELTTASANILTAIAQGKSDE